MLFGGTRSALKNVCEQLRNELDDHLDAINSNTVDVAEVREIAAQLDEKIERLSSRIDELYLLLGAENKLTSQEAALEAFLQVPRTLSEIASFRDESSAAAERAVRTLFLKGVPVHSYGDVGVERFTTNLASTKHVSLSHYFDD